MKGRVCIAALEIALSGQLPQVCALTFDGAQSHVVNHPDFTGASLQVETSSRGIYIALSCFVSSHVEAIYRIVALIAANSMKCSL